MPLFTPQERRVLGLIVVTVIIGGITGLIRRQWDHFGASSHPIDRLQPVVQDSQSAGEITANDTLEKTTKAHEEFININIANRKELESLPTIGPVMAKRIIEYRELHGPFKSTDELKMVKGIGQKTLDRIRPFISL